MTLSSRVQIMERRASHKSPAEMTVAELCAVIVKALDGEQERLSALMGHLPDDVLQRQLEGLRRASAAARVADLEDPDLMAALQAWAEGAKA